MQEKRLWTDTAPTLGPLAEMVGDHQCDVAIIGAGFTGLSAALHLAKAGVQVKVIEAEHVGYGGSGRNVGLVNAGLWLKPKDVIDRAGVEYGERLIDTLGAAPSMVFDLVSKYKMSCDAVNHGTLHCAPDAKGVKDLEDRARQWQDRGAPLTLLDADKAQEALGSGRYQAALLDERAGIIQPLAYAKELARAALSEGVEIFENTALISAGQDGTGWQLKTEKGLLKADKVICATNAYSRDSQSKTPPAMSSLYYFQIATEPLSQDLQERILKDQQGAWDTHAILTSFRKDRDGRFSLGSIGNLDHGGAAFHINWARRAMAEIYPELKDVAITHHWYGRIGLTNDHIPRFAQPLPGWSMIWGYNGRGIAPGTAFGKTLADSIVNNDTNAVPLPISTLKGSAFAKTQSFFIELGARAHHFISSR